MFHTIFYEPLYNLLAFFLSIVPLHDIGTSIILATIVVRFILLPLNYSAIKSQHGLKKIDHELKGIKEKHKNNPQEMSIKMMEVYKREGINPISSILTLVIQIPIFIALYLVFSKGISLEKDALYSFIDFPQQLHVNAFGFLDVTQKNILVGIITGLSAYFLAKIQSGNTPVSAEKKEPSFQESFQQSLKLQMLYVFPVIILLTASALPAALGIYWTTSNILSILQDIYIKKSLKTT